LDLVDEGDALSEGEVGPVGPLGGVGIIWVGEVAEDLVLALGGVLDRVMFVLFSCHRTMGDRDDTEGRVMPSVMLQKVRHPHGMRCFFEERRRRIRGGEKARGGKKRWNDGE